MAKKRKKRVKKSKRGFIDKAQRTVVGAAKTTADRIQRVAIRAATAAATAAAEAAVEAVMKSFVRGANTAGGRKRAAKKAVRSVTKTKRKKRT